MKEWGLDLGNVFRENAREEVARKRDQVVLFVLSKIILYSPVDTGAFRGNHRLSFNAYDSSMDAESFPDPQGVISAGISVLNASPAYGVVYIQNNLPYAERLENGWSKQNTMGIYSLALNDAKERFLK